MVSSIKGMKSCNIIVGSRGGATLAGQIEKASLRQRHLSKTLNKKKKIPWEPPV